VLERQRYDIEAWCHGTTAGGERRWDTLLSHRWVSGFLRAGLSFGSIFFLPLRRRELARFGLCVRDGEVAIAEKVDMKSTWACDASLLGGEVTWWLPGMRPALHPKVETAYLNQHEGLAIVRHLALRVPGSLRVLRSGDDDQSPRRAGAITQCLLATRQDGLSRKDS